jgi:lipopolysaccharide export system permease protein
MTIFDRYLLRRYWHVFGVGFLALFGLYFVIDVFTNVTDFIDQTKNEAAKKGLPSPGAVAIVATIAEYYSYRACYFFGVVAGTLEVISAMVALVLMQKHGELNPILSAGISTFRLLGTLIFGAIVVEGLTLLNQELVIPRIAPYLQVDAGHDGTTGSIDPVKDFATDMLIEGKRLNLMEERIEEARFVLTGKLTDKLTAISAREAVPLRNKQGRPIGWKLKGVSIPGETNPYESLQLTELGRQHVKPGPTPDEMSIRTDVGFDRLYNRDSHYEYLPTWELWRRLRNPSFSNRSLRSQNLYLQSRVIKPILNLIVVAVGVPFVVRKESTSLLTNLAMCSGVMGAIMAVNQLFMYMGKANLIRPELAVFAPIIIWGTAAAWFSGLVRT